MITEGDALTHDVAANFDITEEMAVSTTETIEATRKTLAQFVDDLKRAGGVITGESESQAVMAQQAQELGIANQVSFVGVVDRHEVADYVSAFDIALQPDVVEYASPLKLFEYMMLGRAILAPNRRNILEILTDGQNALLFNPEDEASFASQLELLCGNPELRAALGRAARQTIIDKQLFWNENARKIESLFLKLIA